MAARPRVIACELRLGRIGALGVIVETTAEAAGFRRRDIVVAAAGRLPIGTNVDHDPHVFDAVAAFGVGHLVAGSGGKRFVVGAEPTARRIHQLAILLPSRRPASITCAFARLDPPAVDPGPPAATPAPLTVDPQGIRRRRLGHLLGAGRRRWIGNGHVGTRRLLDASWLRHRRRATAHEQQRRDGDLPHDPKRKQDSCRHGPSFA